MQIREQNLGKSCQLFLVQCCHVNTLFFIVTISGLVVQLLLFLIVTHLFPVPLITIISVFKPSVSLCFVVSR